VKRETKILFMFGPGGVGKTTVSASLGLAFADEGLDVLVVTVDPAKRLKDILGIEEIGFSPVCVNDFFKRESGHNLLGRMDAMMIDSKDAFLNLLKRYIKNEGTINQVVKNRIFKYLSESMIGAQEYLAAEKIYDMFLDARYDIIVVDTAPSKNAFEFIDGAKKMSGFLDKKIIRFFIDVEDEESIKGMFFKRTGDFLYKILGIIFGAEFIADMKGFLTSISSMYNDLLQRAYELDALYLSDRIRYFIIGSPQKLSLGELTHLGRGLKERGIGRTATIINKAPFFYGRREMMNTANKIMTNCKNSDIKANLEFILAVEENMLESIERDIEQMGELVSQNRVVLPDLYNDIHSFEQLLKLGKICRGGIRL